MRDCVCACGGTSDGVGAGAHGENLSGDGERKWVDLTTHDTGIVSALPRSLGKTFVLDAQGWQT